MVEVQPLSCVHLIRVDDGAFLVKRKAPNQRVAGLRSWCEMREMTNLSPDFLESGVEDKGNRVLLLFILLQRCVGRGPVTKVTDNDLGIRQAEDTQDKLMLFNGMSIQSTDAFRVLDDMTRPIYLSATYTNFLSWQTHTILPAFPLRPSG